MQLLPWLPCVPETAARGKHNPPAKYKRDLAHISGGACGIHLHQALSIVLLPRGSSTTPRPSPNLDARRRAHATLIAFATGATT
jgi:hypothetical protein